MIKKIAHFADYHIHNSKWHERYGIGNEFIYKKLEEEAPDRILIEGDLYESYTQISNEAEIFASCFLSRLSKIAKVIIVEGNHDIMKRNLNKISSIKTIVDIKENKNIVHYNKSGFYEDENIVWVNHSHLEKNINPWIDISHKRDSEKIYIDLFHDPINGAKTDNNLEIKTKTHRNLTDFKGDFGFFGDLHTLQFFNNNKFAYPSSTYQQTFGENVENHGFIMWNIIDNSSKFIIVPDDYKFITFNIRENFDYDNINFNSKFATDKCEFRVIWRDYSANINNENENKIKKYISNKWNDKISFEKERIYTKINNSEKITDSIDVNDKFFMQEIFTEYLKLNKYKDSFINEILKIDNIIDERLDIHKKINNIVWNIEKIWVDNFKSYNKFELDWSDIHSSIIVLNGENQYGKTSVLDAITYITHGTTLSTNKLGGAQREKFGDNRYINNKRDLDYCEGGIIIEVNGEKYTIVRKTERKWNKVKTLLTECSTNLEYYKGIEITEENKIRGEQKINTQKMLDDMLGDFDDFIRLTLTNSENLNYLISLDRATFIDSVIRDSGLSIFEKKLEEFKNYKKEFSENKISIDLTQSEKEVEELKNSLKIYNSDHEIAKNKMTEIDEKIKEINKIRDTEIKTLYKVDSEISKININSANDKIKEYKNTIDNNLSLQKSNLEKSKNLKKEYDKDKYEKILKEIQKIDDDVLNLKLKISQEENKLEKENSNINRVDDKIDALKQKEIAAQEYKILLINNEIEKIKCELKTAIDEKERIISDKKKNSDFEVRTLISEITNLKERGIALKKYITQLEENKVCPTCNREFDNSQLIIDSNKELNEILEFGRSTQIKLNNYKKEFDNYQIEIDNLNNGIYPEDILEILKNVNIRIDKKKEEIIVINKICKEINNNIYKNVPELEKNINLGLGIKETSKTAIININVAIDNIKKDIKQKETDKSNTQSEVYKIEQDKNDVKMYETLLQDNKELALKIDNIKLTIENAKIKIDKYYEQLEYIEKNKLIEEKIISIDNEISNFNEEKNKQNENIANIMQVVSLTKNKMENLQNDIKKYIKQTKLDEILKEYFKCIHRDGIPTFLLQKSKDLINEELKDILSNVDFDVFFDEYLNLKMYMKDMPWSVQNLLESSGSERVFGAVALKMALRTINNNSRPNILMLDEVMGKLKNHMVDKFNSMLLYMKNKIDKIIIIEHINIVPFDVIIEVEKDKYGVSSLTMT